MPKEFVNSLQLATAPQATLHSATASAVASGPPAPGDTFEKPTGYVAGGSLVSFASGVSGQAQSDVLNSTLLAQLAADKKYNRQKETIAWYDYYVTVLGKIGWTLGGFDLHSYNASSMSFTADKVILEIAAAALTGQEELVVAAVLDGLRENADANKGQLQIFDHQSTSQGQGNFQISACNQTGGVVSMQNMAFVFNTSDNVTNVLFFHFKSDSTSFQSAAQAQTLDDDVYSQVRTAIIDKLGGQAKSFIASLDI